MNAYQQSLKIKRDNYSALESAEWRGEQRGLKQGEQRGIEIGAESERAKADQEKKEMAQELKKEGVAINLIAKTTKLPLEVIESL